VATEKKRSSSAKSPVAAPSRARKGIQSVEVGVRVIDVLAKAAQPLPLSEVGRLAGISASQAHRYLTSFSKSDLVYQDSVNGRYGLGSQALRWGISAMSKMDVIEVSSRAINELCERLDLTGLLNVWGDRGATCVRLKRSKLLLGTDLGLGSVFPLVTSVTGQVFLAHLPKSMTQDLLRAEVASMRRQGNAVDMREVEARCREVRACGMAEEIGHYVRRVSALAAPVFDYQGDVVAVMTVLFGSVPGARADHQALADELIAQSRAVSESLGWNAVKRPAQ